VTEDGNVTAHVSSIERVAGRKRIDQRRAAETAAVTYNPLVKMERPAPIAGS
jgi:hypothetical protein